MRSSSASRSPSLIARATRLEIALVSCAHIGLLLPDPLAPTDHKHTVHDAIRRCPVHLDELCPNPETCEEAEARWGSPPHSSAPTQAGTTRSVASGPCSPASMWICS